MIRNRLAALMGERGLKITRVAKDTGISRNSITSISQNDSEMIRMETINTLCKYLGVTPCEFFEYEPTDIVFSAFVNRIGYEVIEELTDVFTSEDYLYVFDIDVEVIMDVKKQQTSSYDLHCSLIEQTKFSLNDPGLFGYGLETKIEFDSISDKNNFIDETYNKISTSFHQDIYNNLTNELTNKIREWIIEDLSKTSFNDIVQQKLNKGIKQYLVIRNLQSDVFKKSYMDSK